MSSSDTRLFLGARTLATRERQRFDSLHIMVEALLHPDETGNAATVIRAYIPPTSWDLLLRALRIELQVHGEHAFDPVAAEMTPKLAELEKAWLQDASTRNVGLTNALMLRTIILRDQIVRDLMESNGINPTQLVNALATQVDLPEHSTNGGDEPAADADKKRLQAEQAAKLAAQSTHEVQTSGGLSTLASRRSRRMPSSMRWRAPPTSLT